jgi:predicted ATPase
MKLRVVTGSKECEPQFLVNKSYWLSRSECSVHILFPEFRQKHPDIIVDEFMNALNYYKDDLGTVTVVTFSDYIMENIKAFVMENNMVNDFEGVYLFNGKSNNHVLITMSSSGDFIDNMPDELFSTYYTAMMRVLRTRMSMRRRNK